MDRDYKFAEHCAVIQVVHYVLILVVVLTRSMDEVLRTAQVWVSTPSLLPS